MIYLLNKPKNDNVSSPIKTINNSKTTSINNNFSTFSKSIIPILIS